MDTYTIGLLLAIAFCLAVIAYYVISTVANPGGKGAEKKTARVLSRYAAVHGCKALTGVTVVGKSGQEEIENLLIGPFGVLLVKTLGACGDYYGRSGEDQWSLVPQSGPKAAIPSPEQALERQGAALLGQLTAGGITGVALHKAVYLPGHPRRTQVYVKAGVPVLTAGKLRNYLEDPRFEKQTGLDAEKATALLQQV